MKIRMNLTWNDYTKGEEYSVDDSLGHNLSGGGYCEILEYDTPVNRGQPMINREPEKSGKEQDAE